MSDLDDLLDQLYPGNALANSNPPAGGTVEVDLDGLMDELTTNKHTSQKPVVKAQSKQAAAKPKATKPTKAPGKQAPSQMDDDLDSLINDLTDNGPGISNQQTHGAPAGDGWEEVIEDEPPAKQPAKPAEIDDDLDSLIGDLTGGTPAASQAPVAKPKSTPRISNQPPQQHPAKASNPPSKKSNNNSNEIDDGFLDELMGDLTGQSAGQNHNNKKAQAQTGPGRLSAATVSVDSIEIAEVGHLDSLMDELTAEPQKPQPVKQQGRAQPQQNKQPVSARGAPQKTESSDLDALMAEIGEDPSAHAGSNDVLSEGDLEAYLGQLESAPAKKPAATKAAPKAVTPSKATAVQQKSPATKGPAKSTPLKADLESLMNDLTTGPDPLDDVINTASTPKGQHPPQKQDDDFEDLMSTLEGGGPTKPSRAPVKAAQASRPAARQSVMQPQVDNEVDDIYRELDQPIRGTSTAQPARGAAAPNRASSAQPPAAARPSTAAGGARPAPAAAGGRAQPPSARGAPKGAVGGDSDLDSILVGLDEPSKAAPGPASRGPQKPPEAALPKGVCSGCRKPVTGEAIHALGRSYHPDHFMCSTCGKAIGTGSFYEKEGQPQCDRCYQSVFCKRCANCNLPITNQLVTALGQPWHPKCFVCTGCRGPFPGGSFFERDGRPYCSNCYSNVFTASCRRCGNPVNENVINALGSTWHDFHFSCETCGVTFPDGQFWELDGNPYCETHYREQLGEY